jgi:hypothetical protein
MIILSTIAKKPNDASDDEDLFKSKVSSFYNIYHQDGFATYKGGDVLMKKNTELPIFVDLKAGEWYQFFMVADPSSRRLRMTLGMEGCGDFITDRIRPEVTEEFWTHFSFICPRSGRYLLTFYQRSQKSKLVGHIAVLRKKRQQGFSPSVVY